ncbi:putative aminodeoxychorismate lyase [Arthrobacter ulcerisalmonis]|uniref:Endolytic murein transglycosylase n=2 Tax=Arthrobacter ulcerisalmonis TaxID=2483813 RepID=A0A3P5X8I7_9MICC|nr:endolytic transglycosylase MltG [Arthrobacter ulcerisalmonis]VDC30947.1 putative aminodeoxychorismate lyase [Arthrobacter ulcerisalmonis]
MSPASNDDATGDAEQPRPLTRKELREREKHLADEQGITGSPAADSFDTNSSDTDAAVPPLPPVPPATAGIPAVPDAQPTIQDADAHDDGGQPPVAPHDDAAAHHGRHEFETYDADARAHDAAHDGQTHEDAAHYAAAHYEPEHDAHYVDEHGQPFDEHHEPEHVALSAAPPIGGAAKTSKKVRRRRRVVALLLSLAVFIAAVVVGAQFIKPLLGNSKPADFPGPGTGQVQVKVDNGEGTRSVAADLESKNVIANSDTFLQAFNASGGVLAPGDYTFRTEMKNSDAVSVLLGKDQEKVIYIALSAGLRIGESLQAISDGSGISVAQLKTFSDQPAQFGLPATAKNLEGFLAPGEYRFPLGTSAKDILQKLVTTTVDELVSQGITDAAKQYEAVIVASIVQAEGGQADYGDVAGAIYNRLKPNDQTGGFLQVDSAVTYGLGTKSFNFTEEQRVDKSNPYNTYANPGLPPGPIGSPGKTAIDAAAKPKANNYLYWVTINLDTKETKFSSTLAEHNVYVAEYNAWCTANAGRCT